MLNKKFIALRLLVKKFIVLRLLNPGSTCIDAVDENAKL